MNDDIAPDRLDAIVDGRITPADDSEGRFANLVRELRADATPAPAGLRARVEEIAESGAPRRPRWWSAARWGVGSAAVGGRAAALTRPVGAALAPLAAVAAIAVGVLPQSSSTTVAPTALEAAASEPAAAQATPATRPDGSRGPAGDAARTTPALPKIEPGAPAAATAPPPTTGGTVADAAAASPPASPDGESPAWRWALVATLAAIAIVSAALVAAPALGRRRVAGGG